MNKPEYVVDRPAFIKETTKKIITALWGWNDVQLVSADNGKLRICKSGKAHFVKGWYGIPPGKEELELFKSNPATDAGNARLVIEKMAGLGFNFGSRKDNERPWEIAFYKNEGKVLGRATDETEALAICLAALESLKNEAKKS